MGMGLMTVSSEQGPTTCYNLVRLSDFFPAQLFRILVTRGQRPLPVPISYHTRSEIIPVIEVSPGHVHDVRHRPEAQRPWPAPSASLLAFRILTDRSSRPSPSPETAPEPTKTLPSSETNPLTLLRAVRRWAPLPEDAMWKNASVQTYDQKHNRLAPWLFRAKARGWLN
jgi:hypothetical protein